MSAAEEHLQTVQTAHGHNEELSAALQSLKSGIEEAAAAIVTACKTVNERVAAAVAIADDLQEAASATMTTGEAHINSARASGHGTLQFAVNAYGECSSAYMNAAGVFNALNQMQPLLAEVREKAGDPLIAADAATETLTGGVAMISGLLDNAETQIMNTVNV